MLETPHISGKCVFGCGLALALFVPLHGVRAEQVLYSFAAHADGSIPSAGLMRDSAGNFYGTTLYGGAHNGGTVFQLAPNGTETVLHSFGGGSDGYGPTASLIRDSAGNFYGTTSEGGAGAGTVFKLSPDGAETVLYSFKNAPDGAYPVVGLIADKAGNLYGTTQGGGTNGAGTIFKLASDGTETVLYSFKNTPDGASPAAGLIADRAGNLYGTTQAGGTNSTGTAFKLAPDGTETVLHSFTDTPDGKRPLAGLIKDSAGNLYGTTEKGGTKGRGTIFKLAPDGTETVLHSFAAPHEGEQPVSGLIADNAGNLYGTTALGGDGNCGISGCGVVFKLSSDGTEQVIHSFAGRNDGATPQAGLITGGAGKLYGTTSFGGASGYGTVFELKK